MGVTNNGCHRWAHHLFGWLTPGVGWPLSGKQKVASSALLSKCKAAAGSSKPALLRQRRCQRGLAQRSLRAPSELVASLLPACSTTEAPPLTPPPPTSSPWAAAGCWLLAAGWVTPKWSKLGFSAEGRGGEPQQRRLLCCWWLAPTITALLPIMTSHWLSPL